MYNAAAAGGEWSPGFAIPVVGLSSGEGFRVAFRYTGAGADKWYIDDLCLTSDPTSPTCEASYGFDDCTDLGTLAGTSWTSVAGTDNEANTDWRTSADTYCTTPPTSAVIDPSSSYNDRYLVSPSILVP
jgi:hypothetical protein